MRELPVGEVELDTDDKNLTKLSAGASYYKMHGLSAEEFPPLPKFKETGSVTLPQEKLRAMLKKTSIAISTDESRYVLNGVFMKFTPEKLVMVATDGRRLALTEEELPAGSTAAGDIIVPTKAVNELNRQIAAAVGTAKAETLQHVAGQMEKLARQTNAAIESVAKAGNGRAGGFSEEYPKEGVSYTVQKGDSLAAIAKKTGARQQDIINANKLTDPSRITAGQTLFIPGGK